MTEFWIGFVISTAVVAVLLQLYLGRQAALVQRDAVAYREELDNAPWWFSRCPHCVTGEGVVATVLCEETKIARHYFKVIECTICGATW